MGTHYKTYYLDEVDSIFIKLFSELKEYSIPCEIFERHLATIEMEVVLGNICDDGYHPVGIKTTKDGEDVVVKVNVLKYKDEMIHFNSEVMN